MVWRIQGTALEFCSCEPGCACNFAGSPNSQEGNCEALLGAQIDTGEFDGVDLSGAKVAWALWWPGAIHDRGGRGHAFIDCGSDEQFDALSRIYRGEAGYQFFEIFNSTFDEPSAVDRANVDLTIAERESRMSVAGMGEAVMEPLRGVTGDVNDVRIVKPNAFIWKEGKVAKSSLLKVDLPEMAFEVSGRHAVFARFDWGA